MQCDATCSCQCSLKQGLRASGTQTYWHALWHVRHVAMARSHVGSISLLTAIRHPSKYLKIVLQCHYQAQETGCDWKNVAQSSKVDFLPLPAPASMRMPPRPPRPPRPPLSPPLPPLNPPRPAHACHGQPHAATCTQNCCKELCRNMGLALQ